MSVRENLGALVKGVKLFAGHIGSVMGFRSPRTQARPFLVSVKQRNVEAEGIPADGGPETFDQPKYYAINHARLAHLESLQLPLEGKVVLDVGCGVGHLAQFFVNRGCKVICIDGREENIDSLRSRYPGLVANVANIETEPLSQFGIFDIVFCYGVLYHLENPIMALRNMASVCQGLLLLETMVCDHTLPVLRIEDESAALSQALRGLGCRPSPSYVVLTLNRVGFRFVYTPKIPPGHQEFQFECKNNLDWRRNGHPLRCIFVASRKELQNPHLVSLCGDLR
jgi:SAM-dependent methyltransferase